MLHRLLPLAVIAFVLSIAATATANSTNHTGMYSCTLSGTRVDGSEMQGSINCLQYLFASSGYATGTFTATTTCQSDGYVNVDLQALLTLKGRTSLQPLESAESTFSTEISFFGRPFGGGVRSAVLAATRAGRAQFTDGHSHEIYLGMTGPFVSGQEPGKGDIVFTGREAAGCQPEGLTGDTTFYMAED